MGSGLVLHLACVNLLEILVELRFTVFFVWNVETINKTLLHILKGGYVKGVSMLEILARTEVKLAKVVTFLVLFI